MKGQCLIIFMMSFALFLPLLQEQVLAEISIYSCLSHNSVLMLDALEFSFVKMEKK